MFRMTRLTDYGIVLLTHCMRHPERPIHTTRDLAAESNLPLPTVGKILRALARKGILSSRRGVKGGYALVRQADEISIAEIIGALEGPISLTECSGEHPGSCEFEPTCPVGPSWQRINRAVRDALQRITLHELTQPLPERFVNLGGVGGSAVQPSKGL